MERTDATGVEKIKLDDDEVVTRSTSTKGTFSLLHSLKEPSEFVKFIHNMPNIDNIDSFLEDQLKLSLMQIKEVKHGLEGRMINDFQVIGIKDGLLLFGYVTFTCAKAIGMRGHLVDKVKDALKGFKEKAYKDGGKKGQKKADSKGKGKKADSKGKEKADSKEEEEVKKDASWKLSKVELELHSALVNILVLLNKSCYF